MGQALAITRMDHTAWELRAIAGKSSDGPQIRRLLAIACGFRRSRPGIPNVFRAPFQSDAAHQSNLMAPRVVSSRRPVPVIS
jgi:hypothetical protein